MFIKMGAGKADDKKQELKEEKLLALFHPNPLSWVPRKKIIADIKVFHNNRQPLIDCFPWPIDEIDR